jgi:hypothetical protein
MRDEIIINGKKYDAITGELLSAPKNNCSIKNKDISKIHNNLQRSSTLNRKYVTVPKRQGVSLHQDEMISQFKRRHDYQEAILRAREAKETQQDRILISRFSKKSKIISPISKEQIKEVEKIAPFEEHPLAKKANEELRAKKVQKQEILNQEVKEFAISQAIEKSREESKKSRGIHRKSFFARKKFISFSMVFAVAIFGVGYLTYINLPDIASRITAFQSGMAVETPAYIASGYSPKGLAYFDGKNVNFEYKKGDSNYKVQQSQSGWDSSALLQNYVTKKWSEDYSTTYSNGLTIYSNRRGESVWVNNGKLYKVEVSGNKISDEEIRKIATSLSA